MSIDNAKTGRLTFSGRKNLGAWSRFEWYRCIDCGTEYPRESGSSTMCNGKVISVCPWCRPDSAPWKDGRGV